MIVELTFPRNPYPVCLSGLKVWAGFSLSPQSLTPAFHAWLSSKKEMYGMRRKQSEVTDPAKIEKILNTATIGRMASLGADGYPYITPVNFVYYEGGIYFHCAPAGEKLDNIARNPLVCFEVDIPLAYMDIGFAEEPGCKVHQLYHCVVIRGTAEVVDDDALKAASLNALMAKHEPGWDMTAITPDLPLYKACKVVRITVDSLSAKSDLVQKMPQEERARLAKYFKERSLPGDLEAIEAMGFDPDGLD
jgi:nitroimidazol reductase NimA-like FMN-containing flavoprotein (pyridoxamine 5'-phosphate oxidase superfamily)